MPRLTCLTLILALLSPLSRAADEKPADKPAEKPEQKACRSIHLGYPGTDIAAFYNQVTISKSAPGTYFCVAGFSKGYFGIQELGNSKKVVIFSVWDPGKQNDPKAVNEDNKVKLLYKADDVRIGRFGGEGTGGQSFLDYDWKPDTTYRFIVTARPEDEKRTAFSGYFYIPETKTWKHLVTFSTITGGKSLSGLYSFVEDFRRNKISATQVRQAAYGPAWVKSAKEGKWTPVESAKFTGDSNPALNIDAGLDAADPTRFILTTGGDTTNTHTPLWKTMTRDQSKITLPQDVIDALEKQPAAAPAPTAAPK